MTPLEEWVDLRAGMRRTIGLLSDTIFHVEENIEKVDAYVSSLIDRVEKAETEIREGDSWHERAKQAFANGTCPLCFCSDEEGHLTGCYFAEMEGEEQKAVAERNTWKARFEKLVSAERGYYCGAHPYCPPYEQATCVSNTDKRPLAEKCLAQAITWADTPVPVPSPEDKARLDAAFGYRASDEICGGG